MKRKEILRVNEKIKAKIEDGGSYQTLFTMVNGWQWTGQEITPELAKLTIEVLQEYLDNGLS